MPTKLGYEPWDLSPTHDHTEFPLKSFQAPITVGLVFMNDSTDMWVTRVTVATQVLNLLLGWTVVGWIVALIGTLHLNLRRSHSTRRMSQDVFRRPHGNTGNNRYRFGIFAVVSYLAWRGGKYLGDLERRKDQLGGGSAAIVAARKLNGQKVVAMAEQENRAIMMTDDARQLVRGESQGVPGYLFHHEGNSLYFLQEDESEGLQLPPTYSTYLRPHVQRIRRKGARVLCFQEWDGPDFLLHFPELRQKLPRH